MKIVHGIYINGHAYTRRSVYNVKLFLENPDKWASKIKKHTHLPEEPTFHEVELPKKFKDLLAEKQREPPVKFPSWLRGKIYSKMNSYLNKTFMRDRVEFTYVVDGEISAISVTHALDSFSRKEGRRTALARIGAGWAYRAGLKQQLEHRFIHYAEA